MPRNYARKTINRSGSIKQGVELVRSGVGVTDASRTANISRSTLSRHLNSLGWHKHRIISDKLEEVMCLRLLAFVLDKPKASVSEIRGHCFQIACSFLKCDLIPSVPNVWFARKAVGDEWYRAFKRRTNFTERLKMHRDKKIKIYLCTSCEAVYRKEEAFFGSGDDKWYCEQCFSEVIL